MSKEVAVLCARLDSIYKKYSECDVYDIDRDCRSFQGGMPVIAHPPCRGWGRLRHFAKPRPGEKDLAHFCVEKVRECGGVLEHPCGSSLWRVAGLPGRDDGYDEYGGFTIQVNQLWWGHAAVKATYLYICGVPRAAVPAAPLDYSPPSRVVTQSRNRSGQLPEMSKSDRERTPADFAEFLMSVARSCREVAA